VVAAGLAAGLHKHVIAQMLKVEDWCWCRSWWSSAPARRSRAPRRL